jgi:hypothetical protein
MKTICIFLLGISLATYTFAGPCYTFSIFGLWDQSEGNTGGTTTYIFNSGGDLSIFGDDEHQYGFEFNGGTSQGPQSYDDPQYDQIAQFVGGRFHDTFTNVDFIVNFTQYIDSDANIFKAIGQGVGDNVNGYSIRFSWDGIISDEGYWGFIQGDNGTICVPAPGALLLGSLGVALVGVIRRRLA